MNEQRATVIQTAKQHQHQTHPVQLLRRKPYCNQCGSATRDTALCQACLLKRAKTILDLTVGNG